MATRPTRPKGYLTKGKTKSVDAARKAAARKELTSLKGIAGLVGRSVVEGIGGPKAKAAGVAVRAGKRALSGKALDAAINKANLATRSTKPVRNASGGLKTTTGQGRKKVSSVAATRMAEQSAGPKARRLGGESALRGKSPKPGIRITRVTSGGQTTRTGTAKKVDLKIKKQAAGPSRPVKVQKTVTRGRIVRDIKSTDFIKPPSQVRKISGEVIPFVNKEKVTVKTGRTTPTKRNKNDLVIGKIKPRKASEVRAEAQKERQERIRKALTIRVNPARVKSTPKRSQASFSKASGKEQEQPQGIMVRGKFYPSPNPGLMPRSSEQADIASRLAAGSEKATYGKGASNYDKEAERLLQRALRALESPKASAKEKVKPGVRTRTASLIKNKAQADKIKGAIRNQRRVLKEREIKEAAERIRKAEEAAKKRGTK